jgi:hypothetical protein
MHLNKKEYFLLLAHFNGPKVESTKKMFVAFDVKDAVLPGHRWSQSISRARNREVVTRRS